MKLHDHILLRSQSRFLSLGDEFRGGGNGLDPSDLILFATLFAIGGLVFWLVYAAVKFVEKRRRTSPLALFLELCGAHEIGWRARWQLWQLSQAYCLKNPARLFVEPKLWDEQTVAAWPGPQRELLLQIRDKIFVIGAPSATQVKSKSPD